MRTRPTRYVWVLALTVVVGMAFGWRLNTDGGTLSQPAEVAEAAEPFAIQDPQKQDTLLASLLHRLFAAVDAYRTGQPVWVVAQDSFPHTVFGVYSTSAEADSAAQEAGEDYSVRGPYIAPEDETDEGVGVSRGLAFFCVHDGDSDWDCPKEEFGTIPLDSIIEIEVSITVEGRLEPVILTAAKETSTIVLTLPAFDKFVVPYLVRMYGVDYAKEMRDQLQAFVSRGR